MIHGVLHSMMNLVYCRCGLWEKIFCLNVACEMFCVKPFLNLVFLPCCVFCVMGVKHHSHLGGKICLGEGVSWAHTCS